MTTTDFRRQPLLRRLARLVARSVESRLGGPARSRVIVTLGAVLALSSADAATVGASATSLRAALHISNADIGLLVAANSLVAAVASVPFGVLADRFRRTRTMGVSIFLWFACMLWSSASGSFGELLVSRLFLGFVTASAGPIVASLLGDWFSSAERGRIYGYVLTGELLGAGAGFAVTGDLAELSWRLAFIVLAIPAAVLGFAVLRLPEPARGGASMITPGTMEVPRRTRSSSPRRGPDAVAEEDLHASDAQRVAREQGIAPDPEHILRADPQSLGLVAATRYILSIRTNVVLIIASALGYFYLAGIETFGSEYVHQEYGVSQALANLLMLTLGVGALAGVLLAGRLSDWMLRRRVLTARVRIACVAAIMATAAFIPALVTHRALTALPFLIVAAFGLTAQNPPLDAARLDIMPPRLWGRAEGVRTLLRTLAQALAPLLFGFTADVVFGDHQGALRWTFAIMLLPYAASAVYLFKAARTYPRDVATAGAQAMQAPAAGVL